MLKMKLIKLLKTVPCLSLKTRLKRFDYTGEQLDRISSIFFNLNAAETNEAIQKIAQEVSPLLTEFSNDVALNDALFERVKSVYNAKETLSLTEEQQTLLDKKYKGFSRNGANLNDAQKEILREIDKEQSQLKLTFGENILAETNRYELLITKPVRFRRTARRCYGSSQTISGRKKQGRLAIHTRLPKLCSLYDLCKK